MSWLFCVLVGAIINNLDLVQGWSRVFQMDVHNENSVSIPDLAAILDSK